MAGKFSYVFFDQSEFTHRVTGLVNDLSPFLSHFSFPKRCKSSRSEDGTSWYQDAGWGGKTQMAHCEEGSSGRMSVFLGEA